MSSDPTYGRRFTDLSDVPHVHLEQPARLANLYANAFEALIGLAGVLTAVGFYLEPEVRARSVIGRALPSVWDDVWNIMYLIGGFMMILGLVLGVRSLSRTKLSGTRIELAGLILFGTAVLANVLAIYTTPHTHPGVSGPLSLSVVLACIARIRSLVGHPQNAVPVVIPERDH